MNNNNITYELKNNVILSYYVYYLHKFIIMNIF